MNRNGWRLAGGIWLTLQIAEGCVLLYAPLWELASSEIYPKPGAHGSLLLLIAASCLIPVAMETWTPTNRLLSYATAAAVFFAVVGAISTLSSLSIEWLILWVVFNAYVFGIAAAFVFTGRSLFGLLQRKVFIQRLGSTISVEGKVSTDRSLSWTLYKP